jgi:C4-dicarboxylate-specific signal transduction histidine kinase
MRSRRDPIRLQFRIVSRAGEVVWIEHRCQAVCREDGTYLGRRAGNSNITERKQAEEELKKAQGELLQASRLAGMAEVATNILHNVGNVLNSVNVSASLLSDQLKRSKAVNLSRASGLINLHSADLDQFLTLDPKGRQLPTYLSQLAEHLIQEQTLMAEELESLRKNVEHIKDIITVQQGYAKVLGVSEAVPMAEVVEDALRMSAESLQRHSVEVIRDYEAALLPTVTIEKHKILQILVNLISNAKYACVESKRPDKRLTIRVSCSDSSLRIGVIDNGVGIAPENLTRIFNHGFTTRKDGHGFGLHSSALAANDMGGTLRAQSDGIGKGTTFVLELPLPRPEGSAPPTPAST